MLRRIGAEYAWVRLVGTLFGLLVGFAEAASAGAVFFEPATTRFSGAAAMGREAVLSLSPTTGD